MTHSLTLYKAIPMTPYSESPPAFVSFSLASASALSLSSAYLLEILFSSASIYRPGKTEDNQKTNSHRNLPFLKNYCEINTSFVSKAVKNVPRHQEEIKGQLAALGLN